MDYDEETVKQLFKKVTGLDLPDDDLWELYFDSADEKSGEDGLNGSKRIRGVCYLIADMMAAVYNRPDGKYVSVSSSIFGVSKSVTQPKSLDVANARQWMELYKSLLNEDKGTGAGGGMSFNPAPSIGYLDAVTRQHAKRVFTKYNGNDDNIYF